MPGHPGPAFGQPSAKLLPGIHVFLCASIVFKQDVDSQDKPGHDIGDDMVSSHELPILSEH